MIGDFGSYVFWNRRIPAIGVRTFLRKLFTSKSTKHSIPTWLSEDFVKRVELSRRFDEINAEPLTSNEARHPVGHKILARPFWTFLFERDDADLSQRAIEPRYPFFDLRLVNFLLSIPVMRWCVDKRLMRHAMEGRLPDAVRLRPKTPLAGDILQARLKRGDPLFNLHFASLPDLRRYVIPPDERLIDYENASEMWCNLRVQVFHDWMSRTLGAKNEPREQEFFRSEFPENVHHSSTSGVR
jgi:asparagine synthase (glutamine-hydrolysing)